VPPTGRIPSFEGWHCDRRSDSVVGALTARPLLIRGKNIAVRAYFKWYGRTVRSPPRLRQVFRSLAQRLSALTLLADDLRKLQAQRKIYSGRIFTPQTSTAHASAGHASRAQACPKHAFAPHASTTQAFPPHASAPHAFLEQPAAGHPSIPQAAVGQASIPHASAAQASSTHPAAPQTSPEQTAAPQMSSAHPSPPQASAPQLKPAQPSAPHTLNSSSRSNSLNVTLPSLGRTTNRMVMITSRQLDRPRVAESGSEAR
jgi:hypothetical protein